MSRREKQLQDATLPDALIDDATVAKMYDIDRGTVWRWAKLGRIPSPVIQRHRYSRWRQSDILKNIQAMERQEILEAAS